MQESDEGSYELEEPSYYEQALLKTIQESCVYVCSITRDLEEKDEAHWKDSTVKIELVQVLLGTAFTPRELIEYYVVYVFPLRRKLKERDEAFFLKNDHIYPNAKPEDINFFKDLWRIEGATTKKEKKKIWKFFETMIWICEDWVEVARWFPLDHPENELVIGMPEYARTYWEKKLAQRSKGPGRSRKRG